MTTTTNEITLYEAETDYYATIEDMIDEEIEAEVSGHAGHVKEQLAAYHRYCELADNGAECIVCHWRKMGTEGDISYGSGMCEKCCDMALSLQAGLR